LGGRKRREGVQTRKPLSSTRKGPAFLSAKKKKWACKQEGKEKKRGKGGGPGEGEGLLLFLTEGQMLYRSTLKSAVGGGRGGERNTRIFID